MTAAVSSPSTVLTREVEQRRDEIHPGEQGVHRLDQARVEVDEDRLRHLASALRSTAARHPAVFPLLLQRPATTEQARRVRDGVCAALRQAGLDAEQAARAERLPPHRRPRGHPGLFPAV